MPTYIPKPILVPRAVDITVVVVIPKLHSKVRNKSGKEWETERCISDGTVVTNDIYDIVNE